MSWLAPLLLSVLAGDTPPSGQTWPGFRGTGDSRTTARALPLTWSGEKNLRWKRDLPGYGQSSPVVWKDRVFTTSVEGEFKDRLHLLCLDLKTGKSLWSKEFAGTQKVRSSDYVSKAAPTPAVDAARVYALYESGDLFGLDHTGKLLWQRSLTKEYGPFRNNHGLGTSLVRFEDSLLVLVAQEPGGYLLAIDPATGKNRWKVDRAFSSCWTSPAVATHAGKKVILASCSGRVEGFDLADGKRLWHVEGLKGNTVASPSIAGDRAIIGASEPGTVMAIRLGGKGDVTESHVAWKSEVSTSFGSPLVLEGAVYAVNRAGIASCVDLGSGKTRWTTRLPVSCWASPLGAGDRVYFFDTRGGCTVLKAGDRLEKLASNSLPGVGRIYGVAAVDGAILIRHGTGLVCVGER